ncbi:predicted protein [Nematostella vectensis]|uniref:PH domain-containing protein n=1 Tax=Nematostella vectensis TaxID=45351 RepID=A7RMV2_NEMVE|nr:predicted protein [Nematostella vectensis]|eukprot:XP_001639274.1 predicted protein [Nematostella vectensis]
MIMLEVILLKTDIVSSGVDESELPKPDSYPPHTFEVAHERRRPYYITAENEEEKKEWIQMFELCCMNSKGFKNPDPLAQRAFVVAHRRARGKSGLWYHSRSGGTEEQVLCDSIVELIDWRVMGSVYSNLTGGYIVRKKVREQVVKTLDSIVKAMVIPSYTALVESTQKMKGPMEESIDSKKDEIVNAQKKITTELADKLDGMIQEHVQDLVEDIEKLEAALKEVITKVLPVLRETTLVRLLDQTANRVKDNDNIEKSLPDYFKVLDKVRTSRWPDEYRQTYNAMTEVKSIIYNSNEIFQTYASYNQVYSTIYRLLDVVDGAFFTFEELFQELIKGTDALTNGKTAADAMVTAKDQVLPKYDHDVTPVPGEMSLKHTTDVILQVINAKIDPLTKDLRKTLSKAIPKPVEQIVSVEDRYELFVEQSVAKLVKKILGIPVSEPTKPGEKPSTDL